MAFCFPRISDLSIKKYGTNMDTRGVETGQIQAYKFIIKVYKN